MVFWPRFFYSKTELFDMPGIHNTLYIEFIAQLRRARTAKGFTQEQLASALKQTQAFISKVETCERRLDVIEAAQWCIALGVGLEDTLPSPLRAGISSARKRVSGPRRKS